MTGPGARSISDSPSASLAWPQLSLAWSPDCRSRLACAPGGPRASPPARGAGLQPPRSGSGAISYHPDLEYYPYREFVEAALAEPCYRGPSGYRAYIAATEDVWGTDVRLDPTEFIDLGDRVVLLANMPTRAQASGIPLAETYAGVSTLKDGRVIHQHDFLDQAEALEAVGLS